MNKNQYGELSQILSDTFSEIKIIEDTSSIELLDEKIKEICERIYSIF